MEMQDPQELLLKYKQNPQEKTLILLLQALQPIISAVCYKVVKNEADCQDVTQDVLVKLIHDIHQLQKVETILGWVHQIAFYTALDFKRNQIKQRAISKIPLEEHDQDPFDDTSHVLHEHIAKLDNESQQLILLKFFDNKTFAEIFAKTGKAYSSAHDDLQRILKTLRASLEKAGYFSIATSLEKLLETNLPEQTSAFAINKTLSLEIKKALPKKALGSTSLTIIAPIAAVALIFISLVTTNILSNPTDDEPIKQSISESKQVVGSSEIPKIANILSKDELSEEAKIKSEVNADETKTTEIPKPENNLTATSQMPETTAAKKEERKIEFIFVDEKNEALFGGIHIALQQGKVDVIKGTEISFSKNEDDRCLVQINSDDYFFNEEKNNFYYKGNQRSLIFDKLENTNTITLSKFSILKIALQIKDGGIDIPDGTKCIINCGKNLKSDHLMIINWYGTIKDGFAIFRTEFSGLVTINMISGNTFWGNLKKSLIFNFGEVVTSEVVVEPFMPQVFQVTDSSSNPLENYYVLIEQNTFSKISNRLTLDNYKKMFAETGTLPLGDSIALTDKNGYAKVMRMFNSDFKEIGCYVFGKNHGMQKIEVNPNDARQTIELPVKNVTNLTLKAVLNSEAYLQKIDFTYSIFKSYQQPKKGSIVDGQIVFPQLKPDKYKFTLASNDFYREEFIIEIDGSSNMEHIIKLKPAENYIHGFVKDKNGKPLDKIELKFYNNNDHYSILTNEKGYYKFSGLDIKTNYKIIVSADRPQPIDLEKPIFPSQEELNITLDDAAYFSLKVIGLDGKPIDSFPYSLSISYQAENAPFLLDKGEGIAKNGELKIPLRNYGHYTLFIELPHAHCIEKVIPILKAEDNIPFVFYAVPGFTVTGIVLDFNGLTMEDVIVTREKELYSVIRNNTSKIFMTGKDGVFKIDNCIADDFFWIAKNGYAPIPLTIKDENKNTPIKVTFTKNFQVTGSIKTSEKKALTNINISGIYSIGEKATYRVWAKTDSDGHFVIDQLIPGDWNFSFYFNEINGPDMPSQKITIIKPLEELHIIYDIPKK